MVAIVPGDAEEIIFPCQFGRPKFQLSLRRVAPVALSIDSLAFHRTLLLKTPPPPLCRKLFPTVNTPASLDSDAQSSHEVTVIVR